MSDTPKPTPGPWRVYTETDRPGEFWINNKRGISVAQLGADNSDVPESQDAPNAALIAAACNACQQVNPENPHAVAETLPDVLSILRRLSDWDALSIANDVEGYDVDVAEARALLAKAEGN